MRALVPGLATVAAVALVAGAAAHLLRRRLAVVAVVGVSMQPTLAPGDRLLIRRVPVSRVQVGQIVVIEKPGDDGAWATAPRAWPAGGREWMVKRVAAIPGDPRPLVLPTAGPTDGQVVPAGRLVVLGDNLARSLDSRQIGYIPAERVLGVVQRPVRGAAG
jgi:signal peptidase I